MNTTIDSNQITLLENFVMLAHEIGIENVTLQKLAAASNVSFGKVHYHFGGKENILLKNAITFVGTNMRDFIPKYFSLNEKMQQISPVECYVRGSFEWIKKFPHHASFWVYHCYFLTLKSQNTTNMATIWDGGRKRMEELILQGIGAKIYKTNDSPDHVAWALHSMLVSAMLSATVLREKSRQEFELQQLLKGVSFYLKPSRSTIKRKE